MAIMSDSSIALKPVIETHAALEGVLELAGVDREALQLAHDVREPEPDEADAPVLDERLDVVDGLRLVLGHGTPSRSGEVGGGVG
jgi:hypothetical protein